MVAAVHPPSLGYGAAGLNRLGDWINRLYL
jgi:hypothetical protein